MRFDLTPFGISSFRKHIFSWWEVNKRDLPWRHTRDPYRILVSEIMLQQTQVSRILPKYPEFLSAWPDVHALADAPVSDILRIWKGIGYNRRALYLKRMAEIVVQDYGGIFPDSETVLTKLPGVGMYTARAILVFAFEKDVAMVDTNIRQIIIQYFFSGKQQKNTHIQETADMLLPAGQSWAWHQALMDYGALALVRPQPIRKERVKSIRFQDTDRFIRGRMLDILRKNAAEENHLIKSMVKTYGKEESRMLRILNSLIADGLAERIATVIRLPEA